MATAATTFCKLYTLDDSTQWKEVGVGFAGVEATLDSTTGRRGRCLWNLVLRAGSLDVWHLRVSPGDSLRKTQGGSSSARLAWAGGRNPTPPCALPCQPR